MILLVVSLYLFISILSTLRPRQLAALIEPPFERLLPSPDGDGS